MTGFSKVRVRFAISGKFNEQEFADKMGIVGAKLRGVDDWPEAIKKNTTLPERLRPRCVWSVKIVEEECDDIKKPLKKLIEVLSDKLDVIINEVSSKNLHHGFEVIVYESECFPEISLSGDIIHFMNLLHTDIGFDIER